MYKRMPVFIVLCLHLAVAGAEGWAYYGGDEGGSRYSALAQINRDNVGKLELAWQYRTGAVAANPALKLTSPPLITEIFPSCPSSAMAALRKPPCPNWT